MALPGWQAARTSEVPEISNQHLHQAVSQARSSSHQIRSALQSLALGGITAAPDQHIVPEGYCSSDEKDLSSHLLVGPRMAVSLGIELHNSVMDGAVEV